MHSEDVKQVPFMVVSLAASHWRFLKVTMWKRLRSSKEMERGDQSWSRFLHMVLPRGFSLLAFLLVVAAAWDLSASFAKVLALEDLLPDPGSKVTKINTVSTAIAVP